MSVVTVSDFIDWKANSVTKAFFEACRYRIEDAKDVLASSAGINSAEDNVLRGFIRAYQEMQDFRIDDLEGAEDGN